MVGGSKDDEVKIVKSKQGKTFINDEMLCEKDVGAARICHLNVLFSMMNDGT